MTNAPPMTRIRTAVRLGLTASAIIGCAAFGNAVADPAATLPYLSPGRNQIIAWVPNSQARTASVAQAVAHIALANAKRAVEAELCNGTWMLSGSLRQEQAPELSLAPENLGGMYGWHLRISWDPRVDECELAPQTYAARLSRHLPAWMMTQSEQPLALYHQGKLIVDGEPMYALALQAAQ